MSKRRALIFAAAVAAAVSTVLYVLIHGSHIPVRKAAPPQAKAVDGADKIKLEPTQASAAKATSVTQAVRPKFSEKTYTLLKTEYPSLMPQAKGPLSPTQLKLLTEVMEGSVPPGQSNWPVFKEVIAGNATALKNKLDAGLSANATVSSVRPVVGQISLLDMAIMTGRRNIVGLLLEHGANVHSRTLIAPNGMTFKVEAPLPIAAQDGEDDVVQLLLKHGANIEQRRALVGSSQSALSAAVYTESVSTVYLLLAHGADVSTVLSPNGGLPPLLTQDYPDPRTQELRRLLMEYGANAQVGH